MAPILTALSGQVQLEEPLAWGSLADSLDLSPSEELPTWVFLRSG